ncbi:DUF3068 domain-containing protein [Janibacter melonis]|uniref:DUF3068 domain-containing protein n=1 Tax=Janibacter melonis TaxID=262209 RepID=UPI002044A409|nr:DUF3068 domain-containing protein [Janibacter melonis]MCM3556142.1 DUF3068 domain-containing protein [Janibacter melonis]
MRRTAGVILCALGSMLLVLGALARPVLYDRLATVPLDQETKSVSVGQGVDALWVHRDGGSVAIDRLEDVQIRSTREVLGIPGRTADRDGDAFWQTAVTSQAEVDGEWVPLQFSDEGVSFDRRTGEATNCCGDYVSVGTVDDPDATQEVEHAGNFFKLPFGVEKKTYAWWDGDLGRATDLKFLRTEDVEGTQTYVFQQVIEPQRVGERSVPASLFGGSEDDGDVDAEVVYGNTRTLWIEPNTGVIIKGQEELNRNLEADGYDPVPMTVGTIGYDDQTVSDNAKTWGSKGSLLGFIGGALTPVALVLGLVLLGLGLFLLLAGRRTRARRHDDSQDYDLVDASSSATSAPGSHRR